MAILEWKKEGTVAVITMTNGENRHNPDFAALLMGTLDEIEKDMDVSSVVISSSDEKNWSQGIDTNWLMVAYGKKDFQAIRDFLYGMNKIFKRIILYPLPVIAAINGHAFGNGAILACACDYRFMRSDKGFFCFPEVDINIPFLPGMVCIIRKAFPEYKVTEAVFSGKRMVGPELEADKVIVKACQGQEELMAAAIAFAGTFKKGRPIFGELKKRFRKEIISAIDNDDPAYIEPLSIIMR